MRSLINLTGSSTLAQFAMFAPETTSGGTAISGDEDTTPRATKGFGSREDADATRQAQHEMANDTPVDVNINAVLAREQGASLALIGNQFRANAARLDSINDSNADWREIIKQKLNGPKA